MSRKKLVSKIVAALCIFCMIFAITGCAGDSPAQEPESSTPDTSTPEVSTPATTDDDDDDDPVEADPVTLRFSWWGGDARHEATLAMIDAYMDRYPHVKIDAEYGGWDGYLQKIITQLAGGVAPDIMQIGPEQYIGIQMSGENFYNIEAAGIMDISGFDQNYLNANSRFNGGELHTLPTGVTGGIFVINLDFFAEHNIPVDIDWTWEDVYEIGKRVNEANPDHHFFATWEGGLPQTYIRQMLGEPGYITMDLEIGFSRELAVEAFELAERLIGANVFPPIQETVMYTMPNENPYWIEGRAGVYSAQVGTLTTVVEDHLNLGVKLMPIPHDAKDSGVFLGAAQWIGIAGNSANPQEAVKVLDFMFNDPEAIAILGDVRGIQPTVRGREIMQENNLGMPITFEAMDLVLSNTSRTWNLRGSLPELLAVYNDAADEIAFGVATPEAIVDRLMRNLQAGIESIRAAAAD